MADGHQRLLVVVNDRLSAEAAGLLISSSAQVTTCVESELASKLQLGRFDAVVIGGQTFSMLASSFSEGRDRLLLNSIGQGACLTDLDGHVLWSNDRFRESDEVTKQRVAAVCRQAARQLMDPGVGASGELAGGVGVAGGAGGGGVGGDKFGRRFEVATSDDSRAFEVMVSPVFDEVGGVAGGASARRTPRYMSAVVWDITSQRRTKHKSALIQRAGEELVRIDAEQVRQMHTPERVRVLEQKIVKIAHDLLAFDHFAIRLVDPKNAKLELVMSKGLPNVAMAVELFAKAEGNGISGYVAATGKSYVCADTTTDPKYVVGIEGAKSSLTVPLRLSDKIIGIFNVESTRPNAFLQEDLVFAEQFSNYIALALHFLDLLRIERVETSENVSHTVEDELAEPMAALQADIEKLKANPEQGDSLKRLVDRLTNDLDQLRRRVKDVTSGAQIVLGADEALTDVKVDPLMAGKRVLVVDDEQRIRQVIRDVLSARGCEVVVYDNATSAIKALQSIDVSGGASGGAISAASPGQERAVSSGVVSDRRGFDVLISDIRLPDKTGYDIFIAAREIHATLPVILMTGFGYDPHHSIVRASQEGLQCVLFKPFQAEKLIEEVTKALTPKL